MQSIRQSLAGYVVLAVLLVGGGLVLPFLPHAASTTVAAPPVAPSVPVALAAPAPTVEPIRVQPTVAPTVAPPAIASIGERVERNGVAVTVNGVSLMRPGSNTFIQPKAGSVYAAVDVTLDNPWTGNEPYNPLYFKIRDAQGFEQTVALFAPEGDIPALKSGTLEPGEKVRGAIIFEVKPGTRGLVLSYEPLVILGGYVPVKVALGDAPPA